MTDKELEACLMRGYGYRQTTEIRGEYIVENHKVVSNTLHEVEVWVRDRSGQFSNPMNEGQP